MKVGWAYLGLSVITVIGGAYLATQGNPLGDFVLLGSIGLIYLGATTLADENTAAELVDNVTDDDPDDTDESDDDEPDDEPAATTDEEPLNE